MSTESTRVEVLVDGPDNNGISRVTIRGPAGVLHRDRIDLTVASARERFAAAASKQYPGLSTPDIEAELLRQSSGSRAPRTGQSRPPSSRVTKATAPRQPFPIEVLPSEVREYCEAVAKARSVDIAVPAVASLVSLACAIGTSRSAWDEYAQWEEPAAIWAAIVLRSGGRKTPVLDDVFRVHVELQAEMHAKFEAALDSFRAEQDEWDLQRKKKTAESLPRPTEPVMGHVYTTDATVEGVLQVLKVTPRGLLVMHDELSGFFGGMGRYSKGGADADRAFWLSAFRGLPAKVDRASKGTTFIEKGLVSIMGGIQPRVLTKCFDDAAFASGTASRFLLVAATPQIKEYTCGPPADVTKRYETLVKGLYDLKPEPVMDAAGQPTTRTLKVHFEASCRDYLKVFIPMWSAEGLEATESVESAMSKLECYALRFALIFRVAREVSGNASPDDPITVEELDRGVQLARWFRDEAVRAYEELSDAAEVDDPRRVLESRAEIIRSKGGAVTVREWRQRGSKISTDEARAELQVLVDAGLAHWRPRPSSACGGRPTEECALSDAPKEVSGSGGRSSEPAESVTLRGDPEKAVCGDSKKEDREEGHPETPSTPPVKDAPRGYGVPANERPPKPHPRNPGAAAEAVSESVDGQQHGQWGESHERSRTPEPGTRNPLSRAARADSDGNGELSHPVTPSTEQSEPLETVDPGGGTAAEAAPASAEEIMNLFDGEGDDAADGEWTQWSNVVPTSPGPSTCWNCGTRSGWRLKAVGENKPGDWRCSTCTPATVPEGRIERIHLDGGGA